MTLEIGLWIAGVLVTIIVGAIFVSRMNKKSQANTINISTGSDSSFSSGDIVAGDKNSDMTNEKD